MARRAMRDMRTRAIKYVELEGGHVEEIDDMAFKLAYVPFRYV